MLHERERDRIERERERQHQLQIAQLQYAPKVVKEGKTDLAFIRDDKPQAIFSKSGDQNKKPIIDNSASAAVKKDPELFDEYVGAISFKAPFIFNERLRQMVALQPDADLVKRLAVKIRRNYLSLYP